MSAHHTNSGLRRLFAQVMPNFVSSFGKAADTQCTREALHDLVRSVLLSTGIQGKHFAFKALCLSVKEQRYLLVVDIADMKLASDGPTKFRLESKLTRSCQMQLGLNLVAVYWRDVPAHRLEQRNSSSRHVQSETERMRQKMRSRRQSRAAGDLVETSTQYGNLN